MDCGNLEHQINFLKDNQLKYNIAEIVFGLCYLHSKNIIHRYLRPNNILFSRNGHCKLSDFKHSKLVTTQNKVTRTIKGDHFYNAPEIYSEKGYSFQVDFWSLGVILYKKFFSQFPFQYQSELANLSLDETKFSQNKELNENDTDFKALMKSLSQKEPSKRLISKRLPLFSIFSLKELENIENRTQPVFQKVVFV